MLDHFVHSILRAFAHFHWLNSLKLKFIKKNEKIKANEIRRIYSEYSKFTWRRDILVSINAQRFYAIFASFNEIDMFWLRIRFASFYFFCLLASIFESPICQIINRKSSTVALRSTLIILLFRSLSQHFFFCFQFP